MKENFLNKETYLPPMLYCVVIDQYSCKTWTDEVMNNLNVDQGSWNNSFIFIKTYRHSSL